MNDTGQIVILFGRSALKNPYYPNIAKTNYSIQGFSKNPESCVGVWKLLRNFGGQLLTSFFLEHPSTSR